MKWVPLADIPSLIAKGRIWNSGVLAGLLHVLATRGGAKLDESSESF
ncbi:hypothetical protein [Embleya sp. AB8]